MGSSADWDRERFTMDEGCSRAVQEVFIKLYEKGLIYKGSRIVNWCPVCKTSISDAEVEHEVMVSHHRNLTSHQRKNQGFAYNILIPFILRIDCHCSVSQQRFRP